MRRYIRSVMFAALTIFLTLGCEPSADGQDYKDKTVTIIVGY